MEPRTNKKLIRRLVARDEQAYEILLDEYEAPVYRFFYYSQGNHQVALDQCGETFARFVVSIRNFKSENSDSLRAFIFGIARNVLMEAFRRKRLTQEDASLLDHVPSKEPSVFRQVSSPDELKFVMQIIAQFKEADRQILLLRFVEGLRFDEIAGIMKMPLNSVKSHVHRSRKRLCEILSKSSCSGQEV